MYHWRLSSSHFHPFSWRVENQHFKAKFTMLHWKVGCGKDQKVALVFEGNKPRIQTFKSPKDMEDQVVSFYDNMDQLFTNVDKKHAEFGNLSKAIGHLLGLVNIAIESRRIIVPGLDNDPFFNCVNNSSTLVESNISPSSEDIDDHDADQDDPVVKMVRETYDTCYDIVASKVFISCPDPPEASHIFANDKDFTEFFEDKADLMIALMCAYYKGPEVNNLQELRACLERRNELFPLVCHGEAYRKHKCPLSDFKNTFDRHDFKFTLCRDSPYGRKIHPTPNLKMTNEKARRMVNSINGVSDAKDVGGLIATYEKPFRKAFKYWNDDFALKIQSRIVDSRQYIRAHFQEGWDKQVSYIMFMLHLLQVNNAQHLQVRLFVMTCRWRTNKCYIESRIRFKIDLRIGQDGS